jgi:hypothetical protein
MWCLQAPTREKLPALFLLDSIAKNAREPFIQIFSRNLPEVGSTHIRVATEALLCRAAAALAVLSDLVSAEADYASCRVCCSCHASACMTAPTCCSLYTQIAMLPLLDPIVSNAVCKWAGLPCGVGDLSG